MADDQRVYLDDIYASEECQGSVFRAVVMMAQEARFINKQAGQGYIQLNKKPTTIAMYKFKEGKLTISEKKAQAEAEAAAAEEVEMTAENTAQVSEAADNAFGD
ncbi:MAG: DNA-directed RNA polymerase subunit omega [Fibrobacter sp.]|nr:DNA-directed RNA polymerase subunit omega [Fibrobacter sp.]